MCSSVDNSCILQSHQVNFLPAFCTYYIDLVASARPITIRTVEGVCIIISRMQICITYHRTLRIFLRKLQAHELQLATSLGVVKAEEWKRVRRFRLEVTSNCHDLGLVPLFSPRTAW